MMKYLLYLLLVVLLFGLCLNGCGDKADDKSENDSEESSVNNVKDKTAKEEIVLTMIPPPLAMKGKKLFYHSRIKVFNIRGDMTLEPFWVKKWLEFRINEDRRALIVFEENRDTCLVIVYDNFAEGEKSFLIDKDNDTVKAWVLRRSFIESDGNLDDRLRVFLSHPMTYKSTFELHGTIKIVIAGGVVNKIVFENIESIDVVPPNIALLTERRQMYERDVVRIREKLQTNPDSDIDIKNLEDAKEKIQSIESILKSDNHLPARIFDGYIYTEWGRDKPLFNFDLP